MGGWVGGEGVGPWLPSAGVGEEVGVYVIRDKEKAEEGGSGMVGGWKKEECTYFKEIGLGEASWWVN